MRKKGGDIHRRYILITYCDGIAWKKGYPHTQGAPLRLHTQLHTPFEPHTTGAVKDCPLQLSLRAVYRYPSPWYGVQNTPLRQRVKLCMTKGIPY